MYRCTQSGDNDNNHSFKKNKENTTTTQTSLTEHPNIITHTKSMQLLSQQTCNSLNQNAQPFRHSNWYNPYSLWYTFLVESGMTITSHLQDLGQRRTHTLYKTQGTMEATRLPMHNRGHVLQDLRHHKGWNLGVIRPDVPWQLHLAWTIVIIIARYIKERWKEKKKERNEWTNTDNLQ